MAQAKRKKKFFDVEIPIISKDTHLLAFEIEELENRHIKYDLSRVLRGKAIEMQFIIKTEGKKAIAIPKSMRLLPYFLKRAVRKGTNYVEDSFSLECKDAQIRVKPFLITRRKVSRKVRKNLRNKTKEELTNLLKTKTIQSIFEDSLSNKIQKTLSMSLKKVYPLSLCELRVLKIEKLFEDKSKQETPQKEETAPTKNEEAGKTTKKE